jgi:hypothetical protein
MQDGSWGLTFMICAATAFIHVIAADVFWECEFLSRALFGCYNTQNYRVAFIRLASNPSRWEWNVKFIIWCLPPMMKLSFYSFVIANNCQSSGARSVLPMGVAPEAIIELFYFEYRLKVSSNVSIIFDLHKIFFSLQVSYQVHDQRSR